MKIITDLLGNVVSVGVVSDSEWLQVKVQPLLANLQPDQSKSLVSTYADKRMLLTFGQIVTFFNAKKGDTRENKSDWEDSEGKKHKAGEDYTYAKDTARVTGTGMQSIAQVREHLDRQARTQTVMLPANGSTAGGFQLNEQSQATPAMTPEGLPA